MELFHCDEKVSRAAKPFPHLRLANVLDPETLAAVNRTWPTEDLFAQKDVYVQSRTGHKRIIVTGTDTWLQALAGSPALQALYDRVKSPAFGAKLVAAFKDQIVEHTTLDPGKIRFKVKFDLARCRAAYACPVHLDRRDHLFSILIYPRSGTSTLELFMLAAPVQGARDVFPAAADVVLANQIESHSNNGAVMMNVPWAYHAVPRTDHDDRAYIYIALDPAGDWVRTAKGASSNRSTFWREAVAVKCEARRLAFLGLPDPSSLS